jgi:pyruvate ferredoxin oxidoreductase gamma subunit
MADAAFRVRIHGREGHGATTAAHLLAAAARREGRQAQAVRCFARERDGGPVTAFCCIGAERSSAFYVEADALVIENAVLLRLPHVLHGLAAEGFLVVNARSSEHLGLGELALRLPPGHIVTVPATDLARAHRGRPNAALVGALAAVTGAVSLPALTAAIEERFPGETGGGNVATATRAYQDLQQLWPGSTGRRAPDRARHGAP